MTSLVKLDYDVEDWGLLYLSRLKLVLSILGLHLVREIISFSKSGNRHVRLVLKEDLQPLEVLAVQLIMGSDPVREAFNLRRIRRGQKNWNILFTGEAV